MAEYKAEPLEVLRARVEPAWVDYNRHLNAAYFLVAFDHAVDAFLDELGMGEAYARSGVGTTFTVEGHITYLHELNELDPIRVTAQLLDYDDKKMHQFFFMHHAERSALAATWEQISIHIDLTTRRSAPMPRKVLDKLARLSEQHRRLPRPPRVGRVMGIRR